MNKFYACLDSSLLFLLQYLFNLCTFFFIIKFITEWCSFIRRKYSTQKKSLIDSLTLNSLQEATAFQCWGGYITNCNLLKIKNS